ncbi:MAG: phosphoribosylanthranilate isomerase [Kiritimatiellae bacterium]|nr:phosphoribosylanthranilate isomerase [Kiritimatiellia bacterium]
MTAPKVKICGLRRAEDIDFANALRPDLVGFVFAPGSRRRVTQEEALALKRRLDPGIKAAGVFVGASPEAIAAVVASGAIDAVQLHGPDGDEERIAALRALVPGVPLVRALKVRDADDLAAAEASSADLVLLDAGAGDGVPFDWRLLAERPLRRPFFLAGGLTPDNIAEAIRLARPCGVDASSGVETGGFKDFAKMRQFITEARK